MKITTLYTYHKIVNKYQFYHYLMGGGGTQLRNWLRHRAKSQEVAGTIFPLVSLEFFTDSTEVSTRIISWGVKATGVWG
jgi:hypothetical protein